MKNNNIYSCSAIIPFPLGVKGVPIVLIVIFSSLEKEDNTKMFFYSSEQIAEFIRDEWKNLTPQSRRDLIYVCQNKILPETSNSLVDVFREDNTALMGILLNFAPVTAN